MSVSALFEIAPDLVSEPAVERVERLFADGGQRLELLRLAQLALTHVGHPLNASFWTEVLGGLPLPDRDLSWTEHVRRMIAWHVDLVAQYEAACRSGALSELAEQRVHLLAPYVRWCLTSTVRPFRDRATRALYHYGRRWPLRLQALLLRSLPINDPYVPERILAATYGVAMALHHDPANPEFSSEVLPQYGRDLFDAVFREGAPHATTHILARDYAKHAIDLAILHHPGLLMEEERRRLERPHTDVGNHDFGRAEDRNKGEYRNGNKPFDYFDDNPVEKLGYGSKYHPDSEGYQQGEEHLWWRVYDLGYEFARFEHVDQVLAGTDSELGGSRHRRKADPYGRKYGRIAMLELAGVRADLGLIDRGWQGPAERLSFVDIDPSFPDALKECCLLRDDFLGDRALSLGEWVVGGGVPELGPYLVVDELCGETGPWVLLDGHINSEDPASHRQRFVFPRGLLVRDGDADELIERLGQQGLGNRWLPDPPHDVYRFAGEIPWCETYPPNGWDTVEFAVNERLVSVSEQTPFIGPPGSEVPLAEASMDWVESWMARRLQAEGGAGEGAGDEPFPITFRDLLVEKTEYDYRTIGVLVPVREDGWEGYHSEANEGRGHATPAREIAEHLDLRLRPGTFDLLDAGGRTASLTFRCGDLWHTGYELT